MQRKTPNDIAELIQNLYQQDLSVAEIARRTQVPYSTVWGYTAAKKRGFASRGAYQEDLAKKKGFASYGAYQEDLAKKKGFASYGAYREDLAKKKGFASYGAYQEDLAKKKGFASYGAYLEDLAKKKGFASYGAYREDLAKKRQQQPENRELSDLIKRRLREKGKNQTWLAGEMGVTRQAISLYVKGKITPNELLLRKLFFALEVNHQTIDDLVE